MKTYIKPKFSIIKMDLGNQLLGDSDPLTDDDTEKFDAKAQTFRIFDDTDWSDEDY